MVAEASDRREAVENYLAQLPDVALLELRLPLMDGVEIVRSVSPKVAAPRLVVFTACQGEEDIYRALKAGCMGIFSRAHRSLPRDRNRNVSWTTQLGNAYYNQPQDVLGAVHGMRQRAYASGTLRPSSHLAVTYAPGNIVIKPVNPDLVYVPYYNPWIAYGATLPMYTSYAWGLPAGVSVGVGIGFGAGVGVGAFAGFGWGFHAWAPNWGGGGIVFNHNTYISSSTTVFNHGHPGGFNGGPGYHPGGPINRGGTGTNPGGPIIRGGTGTNPGGPISHGAAGSPQSSTQSQLRGQQQNTRSTPQVRRGTAYHSTRHGSKVAQHH